MNCGRALVQFRQVPGPSGTPRMLPLATRRYWPEGHAGAVSYGHEVALYAPAPVKYWPGSQLHSLHGVSASAQSRHVPSCVHGVHASPAAIARRHSRSAAKKNRPGATLRMSWVGVPTEDIYAGPPRS